LQAGRLLEAISQYEQALRLKPDDAQAHSNLGVALRRIGRNEEAIAQYNEALRLKPDDAEALYNLGNALADQGRSAEALAHYQKALDSARNEGNTAFANTVQTRLTAYEAISSHHEKQ
jgi:tetratricopeptide (TPR) repeat protein